MSKFNRYETSQPLIASPSADLFCSFQWPLLTLVVYPSRNNLCTYRHMSYALWFVIFFLNKECCAHRPAVEMYLRYDSFFLIFKFNLFWLHWALWFSTQTSLLIEHGLSCGMWDLSSPTRDHTWALRHCSALVFGEWLHFSV